MQMLDKKEWFVALISVTLIIPGLVYYFSSMDYIKNVIENPGQADTIQVPMAGKNAKQLIVKVVGECSADYSLRLIHHYAKKDSKTPNHVLSETIKIPAGTLSGKFTRNLPVKYATEKLEVIFIPDTNSAKGKISIEAGVF